MKFVEADPNIDQSLRQLIFDGRFKKFVHHSNRLVNDSRPCPLGPAILFHKGMNLLWRIGARNKLQPHLFSNADTLKPIKRANQTGGFSSTP
jgi:hypothetical protein